VDESKPAPASPNEQNIDASVSVAEVTPVDLTQRLTSIDVLRGIAVLGILAVNIFMLAQPSVMFMVPKALGDPGTLDMVIWSVVYVVFYQKFLAIFSMLFGAGLILMAGRAEAAGRSFRGVWYRRLLWLLLIGLIHAYFIWWGDILFSYAICGLVLYRLRNWSPRRLIIVGSLACLVVVPFSLGMSYGIGYIRTAAEEADIAVEQGNEPTDTQRMWRDTWAEVERQTSHSEAIEADIDTHRGGYLDVLGVRAVQAIMAQTVILAGFVFWRAVGLMLIGMALMKLALFSAGRSRRYYLGMLIIGYAIGFLIDGYGAISLFEHNFDFGTVIGVVGSYNYIGSVFTAFGHIALVMLIIKSGRLKRLTARLAAVGRMALSNYLMHSVVFTIVFYGYGFGLYGAMDRAGLALCVVAMWLLQVYLSPWWLGHFRYGPVEWLWRSLTYRKRQAMRLDVTDPPVTAQ